MDTSILATRISLARSAIGEKSKRIAKLTGVTLDLEAMHPEELRDPNIRTMRELEIVADWLGDLERELKVTIQAEVDAALEAKAKAEKEEAEAKAKAEKEEAEAKAKAEADAEAAKAKASDKAPAAKSG